MTNEDLLKTIAELEKRNAKEKASFGFYRYGGANDESYIKANRKGLELFAAELLKTGIKAEQLEFKEHLVEKIDLDTDWTDDNGEYYFNYIELTNKDKESNQDFPEHKNKVKSRLLRLGYIGIAIILIGLLLIGLQTVISWIEKSVG